jgi:uncharacterized membrane protein
MRGVYHWVLGVCLAFAGLSTALADSAVESLAIPGQTSYNQSADEYAYTCIGTQPFWRLDINYQGIRYIDPLQKTIMMPFAFPASADNRASDQTMVYRTTAQKKGVYIIMRKDKNGCHNGLAGANLPYDATVVFPDRVLSGCCGSTAPANNAIAAQS